jgi:hypothetical protein
MVQSIAAALASASESERDVVAQIYGFDRPPRTAEEVAGQCGLTLPQIEQTVHKVLRRMRHPDHARLIREALLSANDVIWLAMAGENDVIYKTESTVKVAARLPGELLFAIECQYGLFENWFENWLPANARATSRAWYRSPFPEAEIDRLVLQLTTGAGECPLPWPVEALSRAMHCEAPALETAVRLSDACRLYSGYVAWMPLGTRAPRAVRLHRLLSGIHAGEIVAARQLATDYRSAFADDACTGQDAELTMASYPHLFLRVGDLGWCGIGPAGGRGAAPGVSAEDDVGFHRWSDDRKGRPEITGREWVRQALEELGPSRVYQIRRLALTLSNGKIRADSIVTYLTTCDEFRRMAPGVYGLTGSHPSEDPSAAWYRLLLNRGSCMQYVYARWAGEPADAYPLWMPGMEAEWCEWAQTRQKSLLGSLLSVVDPSSWPVADSYKEIWLWKKDCLGQYRLETPPHYPLADVLLPDLLAMVKWARWRGAANWVAANRVDGLGILNRRAASMMALLIGVGAVCPALHWQRPHPVAAGVGEIDELLSTELHRTGSLAWDGTSGRAVLDRLAQTIDSGETGWVPRAELKRLLKRLGRSVAKND